MNIIIIGAGAAGCFAAIEIKKRYPEYQVTVLERGHKALAKVAITGGGRCNLTNSFAEVKSLEGVYPRGHRLMKKLMHNFSNHDTCKWFEKNGVKLITQDDECVFPQSQDAMEIVNTLLSLMHREGVKLVTNANVTAISHNDDEEKKFCIVTDRKTYYADRVVVAIGGQPKIRGFELLADLNLDIIEPVPSLFTLCIDNKELTALMGTVVENTSLTIAGTKIKADGTLLLTHWGISGPATLRLSAAGARLLAEKDYRGCNVCINWMADYNQESLLSYLKNNIRNHQQKKISSVYPHELNARLWRHILQRANLSPDAKWGELQNKGLNRLLNTLTNDTYPITGKCKFKEEFVTCGGVALSNLSQKTLESKEHKGLYFAGEVTDVDAVTGGFNLQAAWTMAYTVAANIE